MLRARWTANGIGVVDEPPAPVPEGWVRLAVTGCGICGSDLHIDRGIADGALSPADFAVPGHEIAGTIADGPPDMDDAVYAVEPWINCRDCQQCLRGEPMLCESARLMGVQAAGGLAELVDVPARLLHRVDDAVGQRVASLAEPWAVSVRAVHRARLTEIDERVLILGGGTIGLLCGLAARDRAVTVGITCRYPHQRALAERFGLSPLDPTDIDPWAEDHQPGIVIETVGGRAATMSDAVRCARRGGRIVVVGVFGEPQRTDYREIVLKELEIAGSFIYGTVARGSEFGAAVRRMGPVAEELSALQTHHFPLTDVVEAFSAARDKSSQAVKVTIGPDRAL